MTAVSICFYTHWPCTGVKVCSTFFANVLSLPLALGSAKYCSFSQDWQYGLNTCYGRSFGHRAEGHLYSKATFSHVENYHMTLTYQWKSPKLKLMPRVHMYHRGQKQLRLQYIGCVNSKMIKSLCLRRFEFCISVSPSSGHRLTCKVTTNLLY